MVRPASFCFNAETALTNHFQQTTSLSIDELQQKAALQFDGMVNILRQNGIGVMVIDDTAEPVKPDAIFPNNWISTNANGVVSVFPMHAVSRRAEKRKEIIDTLANNFVVTDVQDWSDNEEAGRSLEGTGSMIIDHQHKIIYACLSPRTHKDVLEKFAEVHGYKAMAFEAHDEAGRQIYHTNVMMCIGDGFAVFCPKAITDHNERIAVAQLLEATGHENIYITHEQMNAFAGNMLQVKNKNNDQFIVMSQTAFNSLEKEQLQKLECYGKLLPVDVSIIEQVEGGSVRCMMAEVFLPSKTG